VIPEEGSEPATCQNYEAIPGLDVMVKGVGGLAVSSYDDIVNQV